MPIKRTARRTAATQKETIMRAKYKGRCARTQRLYQPGTQIRKAIYGWEIADDVLESQTQALEAPTESTPYPVAWSIILGLPELKKAQAAEADWHNDFSEMMNDEFNDGAFCPHPPEFSSASISAKYPLASRYSECLSYLYNADYALSSAANQALQMVETGTSPQEALDAFDRLRDETYKSRLWD